MKKVGLGDYSRCWVWDVGRRQEYQGTWQLLDAQYGEEGRRRRLNEVWREEGVCSAVLHYCVSKRGRMELSGTRTGSGSVFDEEIER